jgi:hypothetical protein
LIQMIKPDDEVADALLDDQQPFPALSPTPV